MAQKNKLKCLVKEETFSKWLSSTGFLFPRNEEELDLFEELYKDYEVKTDKSNINIDDIINGNFKRRASSKLIMFEKDYDETEISELGMAARKGESCLSLEMLQKMKSKHGKNGK
jgi:hypothetical protein